MRLPPLLPGSSTFLTGGYSTGKSTIAKGLLRTVGGGIIWGAPEQPGARPEYSDMAVVVHDLRGLDRAARTAPYVVWPSPGIDQGIDAVHEAYAQFCEFAMTLRRKAVVTDEFQRLTEERKQLAFLPPIARRLAELGHKEPTRLAKVWVAHRQAQVPNVFGDGAVRISTRPFPGDELHLAPYFGKERVARMMQIQDPRRTGYVEFGYWSADTGPLWSCRLLGTPPPRRGSGRGKTGVNASDALLGG